MREYHEIMMRPVLYHGGRVHMDPDRRRPENPRTRAAPLSHRRPWPRYVLAGAVFVGCVLVISF